MTWSLDELATTLAKNSSWLIGREPQCLTITNEDGLDAYLALSGKQIIVQTILFSKDQVKNVADLNEQILKTHLLFPLTSVGISKVGEEEYYGAFGAISSSTDEASLLVEVETLFSNVSEFLDAYAQFIN